MRDGAWEELPSLNHPRAAAAAAVVGDKIVVVGGQADGKLVPETEVFDGKGWEDVAEIPTPREHLGAASDGRYVYAVGGRELSADKNVGAFERYDPASDSWTELEAMSTATGSVGGRFLRVGGWSRLVGRARPALLTSFRVMTSRSASGLSCPICPSLVTGSL